MESRLLHDIIEEGFQAVGEFLDFSPDLLATIRERVEVAVTGKGLLVPDDARLLHWLAKDWGERLVALRLSNSEDFDAARDRVTRLVALVKLTLAVRGAPDEPRQASTNEPKLSKSDSAATALESPS